MKNLIKVHLLFLGMIFSLVGNAKLASETELNVLVTGGNSSVETYTGKSANNYKFTEKDTLYFGGHYTYGTSSNVESARNWDVNAKYGRGFLEKWTGFFGEQVVGDKFAGVTDEYNTDIGLGYQIYKSEKNVTKAEAGYRYTVSRREDQKTGTKLSTEHFNKARVYGETVTKHSKDISSKLWFAYIPNFDEGSDWNLDIEGSFTMSLSNLFSMKAAHLWKYDNFPIEGNSKYDYQTSFALIAKF